MSATGPKRPAEVCEDSDLKIILLGDSAVGKSKLIERYLMDNYEPRQLSTFALTVYRHSITIEEKTLEVDFWDTAGQERFNSMHPSYYYRAHACILVFDVTRKISYQNLSAWFKELRMYRKDIPCIVVANKIDMSPEVTKIKFGFARKRKLPFYFVSAADGTNVVQIFKEAVRMGNHYKDRDSTDYVEQCMRLLEDNNKIPQGEQKHSPPSNSDDSATKGTRKVME